MWVQKEVSIIEVIKEYRQKRGISQEQLADKVSVSRFTIIRYEKGERIPDIKIGEQIRRSLKIPYKEFYK